MTQPPPDSVSMPPPAGAQGFFPAPPAPRRSWFRRNLAWLIPVGCLGVILVVAGLAVAAVLFGIGRLKAMPPYRDALAAACANAEVIEALGTPIKDGIVRHINIRIDGSSGSATLAIPVSGPKGKGVIYVVAKKTAGVWAFLRLEAEVEGRLERIDLLKTNVI